MQRNEFQQHYLLPTVRLACPLTKSHGDPLTLVQDADFRGLCDAVYGLDRSSDNKRNCLLRKSCSLPPLGISSWLPSANASPALQSAEMDNAITLITPYVGCNMITQYVNATDTPLCVDFVYACASIIPKSKDAIAQVDLPGRVCSWSPWLRLYWAFCGSSMN